MAGLAVDQIILTTHIKLKNLLELRIKGFDLS